MLTEEAACLLVGALAALKSAGVPIWRKRSPKPTQRAGLLCLAAPEIVSKGARATLKSASNQASVNKCVWQRTCMGSYLPVRSLRQK